MKKLAFSTLSIFLFVIGPLAQAGALQDGVAGLKLGMTPKEARAVLANLTTKGPRHESCEADPELGSDYETCVTLLPGASYRNIPLVGFSLDFKADRLRSVGAFFVKSENAKAMKTRSDTLASFYTSRLGKPEVPHKVPEWTLDDGSILGIISNPKQEAMMLMEREHYALMDKLARKSDAKNADI